MIIINSQKISFIVSEVILNQEGKFTKEDILNEVSDRLTENPSNLKEIDQYIVKKLNTMCDYGLIGKTSIYYFSI